MHAPKAKRPSGPPATSGTRDHSYGLGYHGFIYASTRIASGPTSRPPAVLLLSANYTPFDVTLEGGQPLRTNALVVAPRIARSLDARGVPLLSFNIMPSHAAFQVFLAMQRPGVLELDRHAFNHLDAGLETLHLGTADNLSATHLFEQALVEAVRQLPPAPARDPRALEMINMIEANPEFGIDDLSCHFGRSTQVMSRLFSSVVGMSLRDYQGWLKQRRTMMLLCSGRSLTEVAQAAGFSDSPQFSRTFLRWYGQSASFSRDPKFVHVVPPGPQRAHRPTDPPDTRPTPQRED